MRTIIAGSRSCTDWKELFKALKYAGWIPSVVISGTAKGADTLGELWAKAMGIPVERCPADWEEHGKAAGVIRNQYMSNKADALIALWDGQSKGTKHMIDIALEKGLIVLVWRVK